MERYDRKFYDDLRGTALPSARRIVPVVCGLMSVGSVVDIGCGTGAWLAVFKEAGATRILGIDGAWVDESQLLVPREMFRRMVLTEPLGIGERFDLAISLEVAEHLDRGYAEAFVGELCRLAPAILFSAAIPEQGGVNHVNEQWPDYWAKLFDRRGYRTIDVLRLPLWDDPEVTWWYKQNLLLFADEKTIAVNPKLAEARSATRAPPLSLVHPDRFMMTAHDARPSFGKWLRRGPQALKASFAKRRP
jgi:SAM-dependent methyltransferase